MEYLIFGAGRPPGTIWAMEKVYFKFRRKYPGREEYVYLRLVLQSRYPEKKTGELVELLSDCHNLDDVIVRAVAVDFGNDVALLIHMNVLWNLRPCSRCEKYRALSTTDNLCYGCRKYPGFAACTKCHLYWDDSRQYCQRCGGALWKITDGPGVQMIPLDIVSCQSPDSVSSVPDTSGESAPRSPQRQEPDLFVNLVAQAASLEQRCAKVWDESIRQRRQYRQLRRTDPMAARKMVYEGQSSLPDDETLIADVDRFFDCLCGMYLGAELESRVEIRNLFEGNKRLLGNLHNYAGRSAIKLRETESPEFLLRGLAAASIDDGRNCQEYSFVLGQLYRNALNRGLEPSQFFSVVAKLSDNEMRGVLENFETSEDFAIFARPYLKGKKG